MCQTHTLMLCCTVFWEVRCSYTFVTTFSKKTYINITSGNYEESHELRSWRPSVYHVPQMVNRRNLFNYKIYTLNPWNRNKHTLTDCHITMMTSSYCIVYLITLLLKLNSYLQLLQQPLSPTCKVVRKCCFLLNNFTSVFAAQYPEHLLWLLLHLPHILHQFLLLLLLFIQDQQDITTFLCMQITNLTMQHILLQ